MTDRRTKLRWLRRAIAVPAVTRKNDEKSASGCHFSHIVQVVDINRNWKYFMCSVSIPSGTKLDLGEKVWENSTRWNHPKALFIATQLNSTGRPLQLSCVAITELFGEADDMLFNRTLTNIRHVLQTYLELRLVIIYVATHTTNHSSAKHRLNEKDFTIRML